jgi:hypothetical protein
MKRWLEEHAKVVRQGRIDAGLTMALVCVLGVMLVLTFVRNIVSDADGNEPLWYQLVALGVLSSAVIMIYCIHVIGVRNERRVISTGARGFGRVITRYETWWKPGRTSVATVAFTYNGQAREETFFFADNQWVQQGAAVELVVDVGAPGHVLIRLDHNEYISANSLFRKP